LRSRGLAVAFVLILIAGCAGSFAAWRVARGRLTGAPIAWEPPTVAVRESALPTAASIAPTSTVEAEVETTIVPTTASATPASVATQGASPVVTESSPTIAPPTPASPTESPPEPTTTRLADTTYAYTLRRPARHTKDECPGTYILGIVTDRSGTPIAGAKLRTTDPWGNEATTHSKSAAGEVGRYDIPLYPPAGVAVTYTVQVIDEAGAPLSPAVAVAHGSGTSADATCHWLDWQKAR
jgi:hypothetical protein